MQVVILCGGLGTRLREETEFRPKPMIEIGGKPILWHIMKLYAAQGFRDFVLCLGYKGEVIRNYFLNYEALNRDFTINLGKRQIEFHGPNEDDWKVTLADTGQKSQTGARIKRIERFITGDEFMLTYGDGVADINLRQLLQFHREQNKIGTVTGVRPPSRFGELRVEGSRVLTFREKPMSQGFINGGFFVFKKSFFDYLSPADDCVLENEPLEKLAADGQLAMFPHTGFWQCMDTYRDMLLLENLWNTAPPWKVWRD